MSRSVPGRPDEQPAPDVRPYTLTGGRTRSVTGDLPLEALVEALAASPSGRTPEERDLLALAAGGFVSVAELSARTRLPVGATFSIRAYSLRISTLAPIIDSNEVLE